MYICARYLLGYAPTVNLYANIFKIMVGDTTCDFIMVSYNALFKKLKSWKKRYLRY